MSEKFLPTLNIMDGYNTVVVIKVRVHAAPAIQTAMSFSGTIRQLWEVPGN